MSIQETKPITLSVFKKDPLFDEYKEIFLGKSLKMTNVTDYYDIPICFHEEIDGRLFLFHACDIIPYIDGWHYKVVEFTLDDIDLETKTFKENPFMRSFFRVSIDDYGIVNRINYSTKQCYDSIPSIPIKILLKNS